MRLRVWPVLIIAVGGVLAWSEFVHWRASWQRLGTPGSRVGREAIVVLGYSNRGQRANVLNRYRYRYRVRAAVRSISPVADESVLVLCGGAVGGDVAEADLMLRYARRELGYRGPSSWIVTAGRPGRTSRTRSRSSRVSTPQDRVQLASCCKGARVSLDRASGSCLSVESSRGLSSRRNPPAETRRGHHRTRQHASGPRVLEGEPRMPESGPITNADAGILVASVRDLAEVALPPLRHGSYATAALRVETRNVAALTLYRNAGFRRWTIDEHQFPAQEWET